MLLGPPSSGTWLGTQPPGTEMTGSLLGRPHVFERGDKVYLTTPLTLCSPTEAQIEEFAFASAVKTKAPNEHLGWLQGRYVEAGRANLNNAMWLSDELALKSLTPMLMPVTVMHDPRTAVGTIADCKLVGMEEAASTSSRIDTILAVWRHRFPDIWEEAEHNIKDGTMMQSMECLSPWYTCSECGQQYIKLQEGKEQGSWCDHLRSNSSRRILGDVCFTGTGLIFGTRGGQGAYTEAYLDHFQDEIAEFHTKAHIDGSYAGRDAPKMPFVQIDETELATLRKDRDDARTLADTKANENRELSTKVERAEAEATTEKARADKAEQEKTELEQKAQHAELKDKRLGELGSDFLSKLGEFTRQRLGEAAATASDEDWDATLKEKEELIDTKRSAGTGTATGTATGTLAAAAATTPESGSAFESEEVASFASRGVTTPAPTPANGVPPARALARAFSKPRKPAETSAK